MVFLIRKSMKSKTNENNKNPNNKELAIPWALSSELSVRILNKVIRKILIAITLNNEIFFFINSITFIFF